MSGQLRFEILGPQRAWFEDREIDLGPGKQRAVLAVLLLSVGRPVSTGQIVEAVWPEDPPANGPNVVQKYVAGLRRVLEPDRSPRTPGQVLSLTDAGYLLRVGPEALDAVRFERGIHRARQRRAAGHSTEALSELATALDLWQGEPFTGFTGPIFEAARQRLVELRAVALETRAELMLDLGRHRELIGELVELVAEFPVRERLRHQLMLALYRSGRQAEALAAYREFGDLLREEYGIEPGEALRELHGRMLRADPTLTAGIPEARWPSRQVESTPAPVPTQPSVGTETATRAPIATALTAPAYADHPSPPHPALNGLPAGPPHPFHLDQPHPFHVDQSRRERQPLPRWVSTTATFAGTLLALVSFGTGTWLVILAYAIRRRSRRLGLAAVGYLLTGALLVIMISTDDLETEDSAAEAFLGLGVLGLCWVVGAAHVILLHRAVWARVSGRRRLAQAREEERRVRRQQARNLLHRYPSARQEFAIGRPDLARAFDDGGLIDVNSVAERVLATLPGLTDLQRRQVAMDRWVRGPYGSMEELASRCSLPLAVTESLRGVLLFLPPVGPPTGALGERAAEPAEPR